VSGPAVGAQLRTFKVGTYANFKRAKFAACKMTREHHRGLGSNLFLRDTS
jgi:hypothetical protein